jgi:predicted Ser/Thr protein kinase
MVGDSQLLEAGDVIGDLRIVARIGEGGMGVVYLAEDERLGRRVALKVIAPQIAHDPDFQERFEAEARSAAAIDHPNVVSIYSAGSSAGRLFIAMRFVDGTDLRTALQENGALQSEAAVSIVADLASALDAAHAAGLVHRDVKPANALLTGIPGAGTAYLTDFGLTKGLQGNSAQLTGTGQWIGTVDYVAPEQMTTGRVDARTDVYALGCVLFEAIAGKPPFAGSDMQKMWHQVNEPVPALEPSPHSLDDVIARATAKDPDGRFHSAGDLARAARAALDGTGSDLDEHSVATGAAAAGLATASDGGQTRTMRTRPLGSPGGQRTTPMRRQAEQAPVGPVAPRPQQRSGPSGRLAAIIGGSVVLAAGLIAAALVVASGKDATPSRTVVNRPAETVAEGSATAGASATEATTPSAGAGSAPVESAPSASAVTTFSQGFYSIDIPAGWPQEANDEPISVYYESTWHDPADRNTTILVDAQAPAPEMPPIVSAEEVRAQTSQSSDYREISFGPTTLAGLPAARWVFDVHGDRRVDYFLNTCGAGIAVLGSTYPSAFGGLAPTFHRAASSIRVACE